MADNRVPGAQKKGGDEGSSTSKYSGPDGYKTTHPSNEEITKAGQDGCTKGIETK